ncbi:MAG: MBL fold metallo-hydrolase [Clostridiales bacterium]|nr:MBL fold metallo-hydrolase [Clostridiales bacterium]
MKITMAPTGPLSVNTYYVLDENSKKSFIVDPGGYDPALAGRIKEDGAALEYVVLTHGHGDHIGGVAAFLAEFPEAKLVASKHELEMLSNIGMNFSNYFGEGIALEPDVCVDDGDILEVGGMSLKFIHTPGHSPGGLCVLVEDCLFSGDTLFCRSVGRTDFPGSSFAELAKSIREKLFALPESTKVFPGHMEETQIGYEMRHNPFV